MSSLVFVFVLLALFSSGSEAVADSNANEIDRSLSSVAATPGAPPQNFSLSILETVEKKKHLFVLLEEEEQDETTYLRVNPESDPSGEDSGKEGDKRYNYSNTFEDRGNGSLNPEDKLAVNQDAFNGTYPKETPIVQSHANYLIPIILTLGLVLAALMFFTYYFRWTERVHYNVTDYNFGLFKVSVTEVPPVPDV